MKFFFLVLMISVHVLALEQKTKIGVSGITYNRYNDEMVVEGNSAVTLKKNSWKTDAGIEFFYSSKYKQRRYLLLNELYTSKDIGDYTISFGKKVKYWGELEGFNITDVYNQKNYIKDPFDKSAKYGAWGVETTRYFEENSLEIGVKFYEEDLQLPTKDTPYAPLPYDYGKKLQLSDERYTPTFYTKATLISDTAIESETNVILLHGYDNKRAFVPTSRMTLAQYAYRVNKALLLSNIIHNDTIFKMELACTDVIEENSMSDYTQFGVGIEQSYYEVVKSADITLFGEYYRYFYKEDQKVENVDISEVYDNDLFLALRIGFNDVESSELKVGILQDLQKDEQVIQAKFTTRLYDSFVMQGECLLLKSSSMQTILSRFGDSSRFSFSLYYTF